MQHQNNSQQIPISVFEEEINKKKQTIHIQPIQQQQQQSSETKRMATKRIAQTSTVSLSISDDENENPVHEHKRPLLNQHQEIKAQTNTTPIRSHLTSINPNIVSNQIKPANTALPKLPLDPPQTILIQSNQHTATKINYKRTAQLNLKSNSKRGLLHIYMYIFEAFQVNFFIHYNHLRYIY
jgi:hypothetical protein